MRVLSKLTSFKCDFLKKKSKKHKLFEIYNFETKFVSFIVENLITATRRNQTIGLQRYLREKVGRYYGNGGGGNLWVDDDTG